MERQLFDYSPIVDRPVIRWPNNARVALWMVPNVMWYEFLPPDNPLRDAWPRTPHPDVRSYAHQDYGNRVGFWRMLDVLDKHQIKCTAALNVAALQHMPEICEAMVERDWDYMPHGIYNTRFIWDYSEDVERAYYKDIIDTVLQYTGKRVKGAMGPGPQSTTVNTPDLLAEAGFLYTGDMYHDDQPFPINVKSGKLISMPYSLEINDSPQLLTQACEAEDFAEMIKRHFDQVCLEGADNGIVMCISLHAYLFGQPHRVRYLDEALAYVTSHEDVWIATGEEIAEYYMANYYDDMKTYLKQRLAAT